LKVDYLYHKIKGKGERKMIDKKIYYCWFGGGEMSQLNKKCIESWKKVCPDYEIIEINESNFDYNITPYAKEAYEHGNWSYVSNAARLEYLTHNSGFYLDTDVELARSLNGLRKFDKGFITEFESGQPDSGVLGCGACGCKFYEEVYSRLVPGTVLHKEFLQVMYRDYNIHGEPITIYNDGFTVIGEEFFPSIRTGLFTNNTIGIHYFENTWVKQWRNITDGFYPFPRIKAYLGSKLVHQDDNPEVILTLKNLTKQWNSSDVLGKINYFFNPKVIKLFNRDFEAERIVYDKLATRYNTVTPSGLIVTHTN
jgi:hypothetical protein